MLTMKISLTFAPHREINRQNVKITPSESTTASSRSSGNGMEILLEKSICFFSKQNSVFILIRHGFKGKILDDILKCGIWKSLESNKLEWK